MARVCVHSFVFKNEAFCVCIVKPTKQGRGVSENVLRFEGTLIR